MFPPDIMVIIRITVVAGLVSWAAQIAAKVYLRFC